MKKVKKLSTLKIEVLTLKNHQQHQIKGGNGQVSGGPITASSGQPGATPVVRIRG